MCTCTFVNNLLIKAYIVCRLKFPTILVIYQVITVMITGECVELFI